MYGTSCSLDLKEERRAIVPMKNLMAQNVPNLPRTLIRLEGEILNHILLKQEQMLLAVEAFGKEGGTCAYITDIVPWTAFSAPVIRSGGNCS